jgi:hypothetical protein
MVTGGGITQVIGSQVMSSQVMGSGEYVAGSTLAKIASLLL